eukprot:g8167.t1
MSVGNFLGNFDLPSDEESDPLSREVHYNEADIYLASRIGDVARVRFLIEEEEIDINKRDFWDSVPLYYACLTGHIEVVKLLLENGAICSENTFDGDRCLYGALTLEIRHLLEQSDVTKTPPLKPLAKSIRRLCSLCDDVDQPISESAVFQELCDLELKLEQEVYYVNRAILAARLSRFDEILSGDFHKSSLSIGGGIAQQTVWEALLIYVYSERLDLEMKRVEDLRKLAKHYGCLALVKMTDKELLSIKYYFKTLKKKSSPKRFVLYPYSFPEEASLEHDLGLLRQRSRSLEETMINGDSMGLMNDYADLLLDLNGVQFRAHSCVLCCRSDYFLQRVVLSAEHGFQSLPQRPCPLFGQSMSILVFMELFLKSTTDKQFVVEEVQKTLKVIGERLSTDKTVDLLVPYTQHKNQKIRGKAGLVLVNVVHRIQDFEFTDPVLIKLLQVAANLITDKTPDAREAAKHLISKLRSVHSAQQRPNEDKKANQSDAVMDINVTTSTAKSNDSYLSYSDDEEEEVINKWRLFCEQHLTTTQVLAVMKVHPEK